MPALLLQTAPRQTSRQRGVGLIEVLVALVITAFGVLGVIALQLLAKRNASDSIQQTIAAQLAYDLLERMRANNSGDALKTYYNQAPNRAGLMTAQPTPACTASAPCSPVELAVQDLWAWQQLVLGYSEKITSGSGTTATTDPAGGLVAPTVCIDGPVGGISGLYSVTVAWRASTTLLANADVACGSNASDAAGNRLYGSSDEYRRTMTVQAYIAVR